MFDSPIRNTLFILITFTTICGLGLQKVLNLPQFTPASQVVVSEESSLDLTPGWLTLRSAHSFRSSKVLINGKSVVMDRLSPSESEAEVLIKGSELIKIEVAWPSGTPETALLFSLDLDGVPTCKRTFWAQDILHEEFTPTL